MPRRMRWCKTCNKPVVDCICPKKRRKLKVYCHLTTRPWEYAYGAAYTKRQFARMTGANLYIFGGSKAVSLEEDPNRIECAEKHPFTAFYTEDWPWPDERDEPRKKVTREYYESIEKQTKRTLT